MSYKSYTWAKQKETAQGALILQKVLKISFWVLRKILIFSHRRFFISLRSFRMTLQVVSSCDEQYYNDTSGYVIL